MNAGGDSRKLVLIGGPTGGGKTATVTRLCGMHSLNIERVITNTTREPREGEKNGVDYHFVSLETFMHMKRVDLFIESDSDYTQDVYGTTWDSVEYIRSRGKIPIVSQTLPGTLAMKKIFPNALTIFIGPEKFSDLEKRLHGRSDKERRLAKAREEMATAADHYQFILTAPSGGVHMLVKQSLRIIGAYTQAAPDWL